ncbi:MAG: hypothetical protein AAF958_10835 [Planctomycetota bacterium]
MREDLFGYLLGALEPHEMARVEAWLAEHPDAAEELQRARLILADATDLLDEEAGEPPADEIECRTQRTLAAIFDREPAESSPLEADVCQVAGTAAAAPTVVPERQPAAVPGMSPVNRWSGQPGASPWNWVAAAVAIAASVALVLPSVLRMREDSRRVACQDQLQQLGTSMVQFVTYDPQNRLPDIASRGAEAFAGVYAIRLGDAGLLNDPSLRWCPSVGQPELGQFRFTDPLQLVSAKQLDGMNVNELTEIQMSSGGHYAYSLGVQNEGRYQSSRFEGRASFAVLGDSPLAPILNGSMLQSRSPHAGGINLLFEDCSVRCVSEDALTVMPDHPLRNHRGLEEAGVTIDDASLAPSWRPPFIDSPQR